MTASYTYTFEDIQNRPVAVIGAGTLGRRIALMFASRAEPCGSRPPRRTARRRAQYVTETLPKVVANRGFGEVGGATGAGSLEEAWTTPGLSLNPSRRSSRSRSQRGTRSTKRRRRTPFRDQLFVVPIASDGRKRAGQNPFVQHALYMPPEVNAVDLIPTGRPTAACSTHC